MRVALKIVKQRRKRLRSLIRAEGFVTIAEVCARLGVSEATARRDLAAVAARRQITRMRGAGVANRTFVLRRRGSVKGSRTVVPVEPDGNSQGSEWSSPVPLRTTLRDIAERTGFAKTTVSLSLRNSPKIPEATRRVVREAANELGYRPDPALARIAEHRWRAKASQPGSTVAFITTMQPVAEDSPDSQAIAGARNRAEELGYGFEHFRLERYSNAARLGSVLFHRGIRGVIVGHILQEGFCEEFPWDRFSAVGCNTGRLRPPVNVIVPDVAHAAIRAWRHALDRGYRRIGVALIDGNQPALEFDRMCAAFHCQSLLPPDVPRVPILQVQPGDEDGFLEWLRRHDPGAVVGSDSVFFSWMRKAGLRVPGDVGFISLASAPATKSEAKIDGIECSMEMMGRAAFEQLEILVRTNQIGVPSRPFAMMVESSWIPGDTLGESPARTAGLEKGNIGAIFAGPG